VPLKPGDRIERYVIDALLGSGGMGDVYRAHDSRLKRSVALKVLRAEAAPEAQSPTAPSSGAARMLREAQLAAALDHPNVVAVFDVAQIEHPEELRGTTYLAMELIRGEPLRKYIGDPSVRMRVRVRWLEEMARALAAAHAAGLVHRDVKPENVMIREDGIVKVLDFGIAKRTLPMPLDPMSSTEGYAVSTLSAQGAIVGTPYYMAPEQLRGAAIDGRADQFAWAVVAYELLAGKPPWSPEGGGYSIIAQILQGPTPSLATVPRVAPRVAAVVERALEKDPAARFPTMDALLDALVEKVEGGDSAPRLQVSSPSLPDSEEAGFATGPTQASAKLEAILATGPTPPSTQKAPPRRRAGRAALLLAALASVLVAAGGALLWRGRSHEARPVAAAAPSAAPECKANRDCPFDDPKAPRVCRAGTCRDLASADCHVLAIPEEIADDATLWIGTMFPTSEEGDGEEIKANERAADLAKSDFWDVTHGLPSATGMGASRPLGIVACDDAKHPKEVAHHLVDDVGVPAVIGFSVPDEVAELATTLFLPRGVLVMDALCPDEFIASIPQPPSGPRLLWRTMASGRFGQLLAAALVENVVEPQLRAAPAIGKSGRIRVAEVRVGTRSDTIFDNMRFNGKTVAENRDDFLYVSVWAKDWFNGDFSTTIAALEKFQPDVVIFDDTKLFEAIVDPVEAHHRPGALPRWIGIGSLMTDSIKHALSRRAGLTRRIYEQDVVRNANRERLRKSIRNYFPDAPDDEFGEPTYDAVYAIAYAAYAASPGRGPLTGATIAGGLARLLPPGVAIDVGRAAKFQAFEVLRSSASIDLRGAATELDFDPKTGDSMVDLDVLCVAPRGDSVTELPSGLRFNGRTSRLEGKLECR
jgi:serine/threonine protein kinase